MDNSHILSSEHLVHCLLLSGVQIGEVEWRKREGLGFLMRIEQIAQIAQSSFTFHHAVEGIEHHLIAGLIEKELHTDILSSLYVNQFPIVGNGNYHPVAIDIAHRGSEVEIPNLVILVDAKEGHRSSELEVMLYLLIALTEHLNHQLVQ